jgi:hypothetical protein
MPRHFVTAALAAGLLVTAAFSAAAQSIEIGPGGVRVDPGYRRPAPPPRYEEAGVGRREAVRIARSQGLRDVESVERRGRVWRVQGVDRNGDDMVVVVHAETGEVVRVSHE